MKTQIFGLFIALLMISLASGNGLGIGNKDLPKLEAPETSSITIDINDSSLNVNNSDYLDGYDSSAFAKLNDYNIFTNTNIFPNINITSLTSGRVPYVSSGGRLTDTNLLRWDGSKFYVEGTVQSSQIFTGLGLYVVDYIQHQQMTTDGGLIYSESGGYFNQYYELKFDYPYLHSPYFRGNGSSLTDVCLTNGTNCPSSSPNPFDQSLNTTDKVTFNNGTFNTGFFVQGDYIQIGNQTNQAVDSLKQKIQIGNPDINAYTTGYHDAGKTNITLNITIGPSSGTSYRNGINIVCSQSANYPCKLGIGTPASTDYYGQVLRMAGRLGAESYGFDDNGAVFMDYEGTTQGYRIYSGPGVDFTLTGYLFSSINNPYMRVEGTTGAMSFLYNNNANGPSMHNVNGTSYFIGNMTIASNLSVQGNINVSGCITYNGGTLGTCI